MLKVVIESPLSGSFVRNRRYALWCAHHCYTRGESAYASHLFFPFFLDDEKPKQREFGIEAGYAWAECADLFAFYTDLGNSEGMQRARKRWAGRPVKNRNLPPDMYQSFLQGVLPPSTRGFDV